MDVIFYDKKGKETGRGSYSNPVHIPKQYLSREATSGDIIASPFVEQENVSLLKKIWNFLNKPLGTGK